MLKASIRGARLRRSRAFALHSFAELGPDERRAVASFEQEPPLYGVLVRRDPVPGLSVKLVDHQAARLVQSLAEPAVLPAADLEASAALAAVAGLVLDGVLEIESAGRFAAGPAAHPLLFGPSPSAADDQAAPGGRLVRLSLDALRYGESLPLTDAHALSHRLYAYNHVPLHPRWESRFGDEAHAEQALGLGPRAPLTALLDADYDGQRHGGWLAWHRPDRAVGDPARLSHKLYVSPHPEHMGPALRAALEGVVELGAPAFKIGAGLRGLLRPDKMVVYLDGRAALERTAAALAPRLAGLRAQGVPFSAELTSDGMLSWGMDPPVDEAMIPWRGTESWRLWVANELARALLHARHDPGPVAPWRFALDRVRLHGVDTATWAPIGATAAGDDAPPPTSTTSTGESTSC